MRCLLSKNLVRHESENSSYKNFQMLTLTDCVVILFFLFCFLRYEELKIRAQLRNELFSNIKGLLYKKKLFTIF